MSHPDHPAGRPVESTGAPGADSLGAQTHAHDGVASASTATRARPRWLVPTIASAAALALIGAVVGIVWATSGAGSSDDAVVQTDAPAASTPAADALASAAETSAPAGDASPAPTSAPTPTEIAQPSRDAVRASLLSADTPMLCAHEPAQFVDGAFDYGQMGGAWLAFTGDYATHSFDEATAFTDVTGDGIDDVAVVVSCYMGGVGWPDHIVFYEVDADGGVSLLDGVGLGDISGTAKGAFTSMTPIDGGVDVQWAAAESNADANPVDWSAAITWNGSSLDVAPA